MMSNLLPALGYLSRRGGSACCPSAVCAHVRACSHTHVHAHVHTQIHFPSLHFSLSLFPPSPVLPSPVSPPPLPFIISCLKLYLSGSCLISHLLFSHPLFFPPSLFLRCLPPQSSPYPTQCVCHIFILYFYCLFSMFRFTNTYHCFTVAYSIQYSNMLYSFVVYEQ